MKTILVPTDLSPMTDSALSVAVGLARLYGAEVCLLHSLMAPLPMPAFADGPAMPANYLTDVYADVEEDARQALYTFMDKPAYSDVTIIPRLLTNSNGLIRNVTEQPVDLIVMASLGAAGLEELLVGSNAEVIVRHAHCPVLVVKKPIAHFQPENIVCAIDVDDRLKKVYHMPFQMGERGLHQFLYVHTPTDNRDVEGVREWVNDFACAKGITEFEFIIRPAKTVPEGILRYANDVQADLIVLFTQGRTGIRHLIQGSVAEDVLNHAEMPVLVMRV